MNNTKGLKINNDIYDFIDGSARTDIENIKTNITKINNDLTGFITNTELISKLNEIKEANQIPNNSTITLKNGTNNDPWGSFTLNQNDNKTIDIPVNDSTISFKRPGIDNDIDTLYFSLNQNANKTIELPINDSTISFKRPNIDNDENNLYFSLNQNENKTIELPIYNTIVYLEDIYNNSIGSFYLNNEAAQTIQIPIYDSTISIKNGSKLLGSFTLNSKNNIDVDIANALPSGRVTINLNGTEQGSFELNSQNPQSININTATTESGETISVNNSTIKITDFSGTTEYGTFTLNQNYDGTIYLPIEENAEVENTFRTGVFNGIITIQDKNRKNLKSSAILKTIYSLTNEIILLPYIINNIWKARVLNVNTMNPVIDGTEVEVYINYYGSSEV